MKIYLAGNFEIMRTSESEYGVMKKSAKQGAYRRLVSFYYYTDDDGKVNYTGNVINAVKRFRKNQKED